MNYTSAVSSYLFAGFQLDLDSFVLKRGMDVIPIQPKAMDVLRYLVERRGQMVSKSELLDAVWRDEAVNEAVISWSISHIRRALGQARGATTPIETVHGRGYRFSGEISLLATAPAATLPQLAEAVPRSVFVGRERVMRELSERVQAAAAGHGSLLVLTGEAGIGKTECARELSRMAASIGMQTLFGRCPQPSGAPPLWPLASALSQAPERRSQLVAYARRLLRGQLAAPGDAPTRPELGRFSMIEEAARQLRELATEPTLLVLDDVHWAAEPTLRVIGFLAPELPELRLCLLLTLRESERTPGSARDEPLLRVLREAHAVPLASFEVDQVGAYLKSVCGQPPSLALAQAVHRASDGLPLFVREVVRSLTLEHGADTLARLEPSAVRIPSLARDLLRERYARLPKQTAGLLATAAVLGEVFDLSLLAALAELEADTLLEDLEPALADGQLECEAPHRYRFVHALFQTVLYDDLLPSRRAGLHRKVSGLLEARRDPASRAELARHAYLALPTGDAAKAVEHARAAGDAAAASFDHAQAVRFYTWALDAQATCAAVEPEQRAALLLALAREQRHAGHARDATETATQLIKLAREHGMHETVVRATYFRRPTVVMAIVPDPFMRATLEWVIDTLPSGQDAVRVSALAQLAFLPPYEPDLSASKQLSARALALAEQQPDRALSIEALRARLFALSGPDDIDELLRVADRMLALEREGLRNVQIMDARRALFAGYVHAGRIAEADAALAELAAVIPTPFWPEASFYHERLAAQRLFLDARFDDCVQRWQQLRRSALRAGISYADYFWRYQRHLLRVEREGAVPVELERRQRGPGLLAAMTRTERVSTARYAAEAGQLDCVREQLVAAGNPGDYPRDGSYLHALACWSICAVALGDRELAEQLLALLSPYVELNTPDTMGYYLGSVAYFLGKLCAALGDAARASDYFEHALARNRAFQYRAGVVRTLLAHAELEQARGRAAPAAALRADARVLAEELGMQWAVAAASVAP